MAAAGEGVAYRHEPEKTSRFAEITPEKEGELKKLFQQLRKIKNRLIKNRKRRNVMFAR